MLFMQSMGCSLLVEDDSLICSYRCSAWDTRLICLFENTDSMWTNLHNSYVSEISLHNINNCTQLKVSESTFERFKLLEKFTATNAHITDLSNIDLRSLTELKFVSFSYNDITELSAYIFEWTSNLDILDLSHNQIVYISDTAFKVRLTKESDKQIYYEFDEMEMDMPPILPAKIKQGRSNIKELYLNNNRLKTLNATWFEWLPNLYVLNVNGNFLKVISFKELFKNNIQLNRVYASQNYIQEISNISTEIFRNVEHVDFSNNPSNHNTYYINVPDINVSNMRLTGCRIYWLTSVFDASWNNITDVIVERSANFTHGLRRLNLAHNSISSAVNLTDLVNLDYLDLSYNLMETLETASLQNLGRLTTLKLNHNNIIVIDYGVFRGMNNLKYLNLSFNRLQQFNLQNLMNSLITVNIYGNNISYIDVDLKRKAPKLQTIYGGENNWDCNVLTMVVLALNLDYIRLTSTPNPFLFNKSGFNSSIRDIGCYGTAKPQVVESNTNTVSLTFDVKQRIEMLIDEKIHQFETRLLDVIANMTNQNMKSIVTRLDELSLHTNITQVS